MNGSNTGKLYLALELKPCSLTNSEHLKTHEAMFLPPLSSALLTRMRYIRPSFVCRIRTSHPLNSACTERRRKKSLLSPPVPVPIKIHSAYHRIKIGFPAVELPFGKSANFLFPGSHRDFIVYPLSNTGVGIARVPIDPLLIRRVVPYMEAQKATAWGFFTSMSAATRAIRDGGRSGHLTEWWIREKPAFAIGQQARCFLQALRDHSSRAVRDTFTKYPSGHSFDVTWHDRDTVQKVGGLAR